MSAEVIPFPEPPKKWTCECGALSISKMQGGISIACGKCGDPFYGEYPDDLPAHWGFEA